jgi:glycosyltransferase involved in cell wall biosynthesis
MSDPRAALVSVVIPAYNEQQNVRAVYEAVRRSMDGQESLEIIFVDDGSTDGTAECVRELRAQDPSVRLIRFGRNFGQQPALMAGLEAARGAAVITLDCDLQHPPELLSRMMDRRCGIFQDAHIAALLPLCEPAQRNSGGERRRRLPTS